MQLIASEAFATPGPNPWSTKPILFRGESPPSGYRFVPAGSHYLTRHCRVLAKLGDSKVYALYLSRIKRPTTTFTAFAGQSGLYVPEKIFAM
ncbi:hypothetical protein E4U59_005874, partial [Claviceps monticola]